MIINYWRDGTNNQVYLSEIVYTVHSQKQAIHKVSFVSEVKPDSITSYTLGYPPPLVTAYRLKEIRIYTNNNLWKRYVLNYTTSNTTWNSLLNKVQEFDGSGLSLPSTDFYYTQGVNWDVSRSSWTLGPCRLGRVCRAGNGYSST